MNKISGKEIIRATASDADTSILGDLSVPDAVINAQKNASEKETGQKYYPKVYLFFSFDIVNSTMYKTTTGNWPVIIRGLLEDIRARVFRINDLSSCFLWKVIGDEMIFVLPIQSEAELPLSVDAIFEVTQRISMALKSGKFFDSLEDQRLQRNEINILKTQNTLSIKTTAWIAVLNSKLESPYDNIAFNYTASPHNQIIQEFLGKDIDAGFRLKGYTQDRRLAVSVELAYFLLKDKNKNLHIMDYVRLKGVWNNALYPVIWYYNPEIIQACHKEMTGNTVNIAFSNSFRYDETDGNPLIKKYFLRKRAENSRDMMGEEILLAPSMYEIDSALEKIIPDRNLEPKMKYIESLFSEDILIATSNPYAYPLEMHCAVVCCNVEERTVLITHRGINHSSNPNKWEFGCCPANSEIPLKQSITEYYQKAFGIEIELVLDKTREEQQPLPIAVYEINKLANIKKGIIFVAKVIRAITSYEFRPEGSHDDIRWIRQEELKNFSKDEVVQDFHNTLEVVFSNFDSYFKQ